MATTITLTFDIAYLKSANSLAKLTQVALGIVCLALLLTDVRPRYYYYDYDGVEIFHYAYGIILTFLISTLMLWIARLLFTANTNVDSLKYFDKIHNAFAMVLIFSASMTLTGHITNINSIVLGLSLINSFVYLVCLIMGKYSMDNGGQFMNNLNNFTNTTTPTTADPVYLNIKSIKNNEINKI